MPIKPGQLTAMISSTALDLPAHREQTKQACLDEGVHPICMEHLPARDATGIAASLEMVDQADIYIGIYAWRYGWIPDGSDISITEMEFNRALERKERGKLKEILIFVMHDDHPVKKSDVEDGAQSKLNEFKERASKGRVRKEFKSAEELRGLVMHALADFKHRLPPTTDDKPVPDVSRKSSTATPNNLPRLHSFYGRAEELKKIAEALLPSARTWGALIDGPGGIGKTSLAIRAAESVPNGQFKRTLFLSAKEREMSADGERKLTGFILPGYLEMLNEIARLLDQPDLAKSIESERARLVLAALEPEHALLILDNLETLTPEHRDQLFNFIGHLPQGCKAIVTSRRRTDVDARIIRLEKLDHDAALAFLTELAIDRPLLAKASEVQRGELYEETGGSPLLLRWIAGQLGKGRCRSVADALAFIRSAPSGNDPLEFIFGDLLETFTDSETKALAALTYFTRPMGMKFIAELATLTKAAAQTALGDLASRALVVLDEAEENFALVPMVADFLRRKRPEAIQQTGDRLADRAYALIVENGYRQDDRFPVLDAAWPTVAPALPVFLSGSDVRLQTVCGALFRFLDFTGRWDELLTLSREAESKAVATHDFSQFVERAYHAGWVHYLRGQSAEVFACADRAATHWPEGQAGPRERALALRLRGIGHEMVEDYAAARASYNEALELWRTLGRESIDVAIILNDVAEIERLTGDYSAAERDFREALRIASSIGYREGVANHTGNLAELALDRENWPGAERLAREALSLSEQVGRKELIADDCFYLAKALARQGRQAEGLFHAQRSVEIYAVLRSPHLKAARETLTECEAGNIPSET